MKALMLIALLMLTFIRQQNDCSINNRAGRKWVAILLLMLSTSICAWGQVPEITTDDDIANNTKKLYLIQTNAFQSFYMAPQSNNTITTNNILGDYMLWYFLDAGNVDDVQYYYIVNNSTGKYICHGGGTDNNDTKRSVKLEIKNVDNDERCKFYLNVDNENGTIGFYNIDAKGKPSYYGLNKRNGSELNQYPIRLTNDQYIHDSNSKWKFIRFNGSFINPTPPFTVSTDLEKHYYVINNFQKNTFFASTDDEPDKVTFTNQTTERRAWYFKEASSDSWYQYYYIINPSTGGKYMYYSGTATNGSNQTDAVSVKAYDSNYEDRYLFVVVQAAKGNWDVDKGTDSRKECYAIIPKLLIDKTWTSNSIGLAEGSINDGVNLGIISSRVQNNGAHWKFIATSFSTVCDNPVITFDNTTGKATISTTTSWPSIHYTTDGTTVPSSTIGTEYSEPFALTEQTTIKAIVTKDGYTDSEVTTTTIYKVATPTIQEDGNDAISITTTTPGATIYYTTDGTNPTTSSTQYTAPSANFSNQTIRAIAVKDGMINSDIVEGCISITCATPVISFNNTNSMVTITCATEGSTIYYTTNGNDPTAQSTPYNNTPFLVNSSTTVKAIATHATKDPSSVAELVISQVATPTIQDNGSNAISITTTTPDAAIYYTTDGSTPNTSSNLYTGPLTENVSNVTIKAIAVKENMITSAMGSGLVKLKCATPVITRVGLTFTLSCSMPTDATLYYTIGSGSETQYNTPVTFSIEQLPVTVTAVAKHSSYYDSESASLTFTKGEGTASSPYLIYSDTDFRDFVNQVNSGNNTSAYYKLCTDVSASDISAITTTFTGSFDGDSYVINGLTHPLFNIVEGGTVKNVTLKGVNISSSADTIGAIACIAKGYTRIYNCGILPNTSDFPEGTHPSVSTNSECAGGLVGSLRDDSRVINCYSYADVSAAGTASGIVGRNTFASTAAESDGKYANLRTAIVNCLFYGDILGGTNQYGVYGGELITNATATGISSYNYYRSGSTFSTTSGQPTAYNCSFPAEERYLTQVEFHRSLLNSNRELCGWWVGSDVAPRTLTTAQVQAVPKDASLMNKWVVDPNVAPYPILKPFGKYPSIVNANTGTPWFDRDTASSYEGKKLGTLQVTVKSGYGSIANQTLDIPITDMDTLHYDFGYYKVQLPYYNTVFGNPDGATWEEKYAGNYTSQVVTGWKITGVTGGTQGSFVANWENGYNFADRKCTDKDLYSVSNRVFAQGGYYYVPDSVTAITIEAYWGKAIYVRNDEDSYDRVNITLANTGSHFAPAGTRDNNVNGATINTSIRGSLTSTNIDAKKTVYDYALVLVGNVQESVGLNDIKYSASDYRGFTIMSVDLDFDEEPDYCLEWQLGAEMKRQVIAPIRFDFLPVVELGIAGKLHNSTNFYSLGCYRSQGHFEVTETSFIRFGQFEFELGTRDEGPIILNGGIYDQYCRGRNGETNQHINYVILGGHIVMPSFTPGAHVNNSAKYKTRHCAVNALGGDFTSFYLTGGYNEGIEPYEDNPHCYIDGGRFGTIAAAYKEGISGDVTWRINHALIDEFYGGGVMSQATGSTYKIVKGNIDVVIDNSIVGKYCGGPKFGDMVPGNTVKTSATNTVFTQYFGAGNGGTNYVQYVSTDVTGAPVSNWSGTISTNYHPGQYRNAAQGYEADYDVEVINTSTGDQSNKVVNRSYYYSAQFATTNTGNVTSELTGCTIETNFYGGGFLGGVNGSVTSTLTDCTIKGSVFGAGYSASAGTVSISNNDKTAPSANVKTGIIKPQSGGTSTTYYWTHETSLGGNDLSTSSPAAMNVDGKNYLYTEIPLDNLGAVSGAVTLIIDGNSIIGTAGDSLTGHVYGGGEQSAVKNTTSPADAKITVTIRGNAEVLGDVFGGGNKGDVSGSVTVNIVSGTIKKDVYGGGALANTNTGNLNNDQTITTNRDTTEVNLHPNATIYGDVYGGGRGQKATNDVEGVEAIVYGDVTVYQLGAILVPAYTTDSLATSGRIFGCNNANGTPKGHVLVYVSHTTANNQNDKYALAAVYGGGNEAAYIPYKIDQNDSESTEVVIDGCSDVTVHSVYGGGNAASTPATNVRILGAKEIEFVYGGGNGAGTIDGNPNPGANVGYKAYPDSVAGPDQIDKRATYIYGSGVAKTEVSGGKINYIYGGSNTKGNVRYTTIAQLEEVGNCELVVGGIYGGGREAYMEGNARIELGCMTGMEEIYGGSEKADVGNDIELTITSGTFKNIFGGNNKGGRIFGSITVNIEQTGCLPINIENLYLGGNNAPYSVYGYADSAYTVILDGESITHYKLNQSAESKYNDPVLNIRSFHTIGTVYGGGNGEHATMVGNPTVDINITHGWVNGEYTGTSDYSGSPQMLEDDGVIGTVFGGGNEAEVIGNTTILIGDKLGTSVNLKSMNTLKNELDADEDHIITEHGITTTQTSYGVTYTNETNPAKTLSVTNYQTVNGANITGNVYGGGNQANVTGNTNIQLGPNP